MSTKQSRKSFVTQILGLMAAVGLAPRLVAKPGAPAPADATGAAPFKIQPDARAVARSAEVR